MTVRDSVIATLTEWAAPDEHQDALRHALLAFVLARPDACLRECVPGHVTASVAVACSDNTPFAPNVATANYAPSLGVDIANSVRTASGLYYRDITVGAGTLVPAN